MTKKTTDRMKVNLYCAGKGENMRFTTATTQSLASLLLGGTAVIAGPEETALFWEREGLSKLNHKQIEKKYSVAKSTVGNWRRKAGGNMADSHADKRARVVEALTGKKTISQVCQESGVSIGTVQRIAVERGYEFKSGIVQKRPSDAQILALAPGKTYNELAAAAGIKVVTLRNYLDKNTELRMKVRELIRQKPKGSRSHNKLHIPTLVDMYKSGMSVSAISEEFDVTWLAVRYWLRKEGVLKTA